MSLKHFILLSAASFAFIAFYWKRQQLSIMKYCTIEKCLKGKIVLITGASSGLGRELTYELARRGAEIIMGCRSVEKANEAIQWINSRLEKLEHEAKKHVENPVKLHVIPLDLTSLRSVEHFAQAFLSRFQNLHILVNNAGIMGGQLKTNAAGIELQMAVNHLGHFYLTNLLTDVLKKSAPSRIVIVSSGYYRKASLANLLKVKEVEEVYQPLSSYARSKLANCLHGLALSKRLQPDQVGVYTLRPGFVRGTELGRHFSQLHSSLLYPIMWLFSKDISQGVQTYLHCCLSEPSELKSGALYNNCDVDESTDPRLLSQDAAEELFLKSQKWLDESLALEIGEEK